MMKRFVTLLLMLGAVQISMVRAWSGEEFDMRACPLSDLTFVDPWGGDQFTVTAVAEYQRFLCEAGLVAQPPEGEECQGPYGQLLLFGELADVDFLTGKPGTPREAVAIWNVIKGAPCCGWSVVQPSDPDLLTLRKQATFRDAADMPKLRDYPFASIEVGLNQFESDESLNFGNPKHALICRAGS